MPLLAIMLVLVVLVFGILLVGILWALLFLIPLYAYVGLGVYSSVEDNTKVG